MREVLAQIMAWQRAGKAVAIATNVKLNGSSLRPLGAKMAATTDMEIAGSVTGGCIEGAVYEEAQEVIQTGRPKRLHYGVVNGQNPWDIGLSCGGTLDVLVESLDSTAWRELFPLIKTGLETNQLAAVATALGGPWMGNKMILLGDGRVHGSLGDADLDRQALVWMKQQMTLQEAAWTTLPAKGEEVEMFVDILAPAARLIVIGAVHIAIPLVSLGKVLGFTTIVIDPREAFATRERFQHADQLIVEWPSVALEKLHPDQGTYIAVISHDEKLDNPALAVALTSPTRYVGVLGARKNLPMRLEALRELGVNDEQLGRLYAPIGIPVGAVKPEEIALSILAEMVAARHGQSKISLHPGQPAGA